MKSIMVEKFSDFLNIINSAEQGVYFCFDNVLKKDDEWNKYVNDIGTGIFIFVFCQKRFKCKVIFVEEEKFGSLQKCKTEKEHLEKFSKEFGAKIPFVTDYYICCFNQDNKEKIKEGFKGAFDLKNIMTGHELCNILNIDYDEIIKIRTNDAKDNLIYFCEELKKINEVMRLLKK